MTTKQQLENASAEAPLFIVDCKKAEPLMPACLAKALSHEEQFERFVLASITPEIAKEMLATSGLNRNVVPRNVDRISRMMNAEEWRRTTETIKFNQKGELIDGQHRLHAVIKSGRTVAMWVSYNNSEDSMAVLDTGSRRSPAQCAKISGLSHVGDHEISIVRTMHLAPNASRSGNKEFTPLELINMYKKHEQAVRFANQQYRHLGSRPAKNGVVRGIVARAWYTQDKERLQRFLYVFDTRNSTAPEDSAAIVLRNRYDSGFKDAHEGRMEIYCLTMRALHRFLKREETKILKALNEQVFPVPSIDDVPRHLWSKL